MTKEKSKIIYGVAAGLMVFHHLFGFPERITEEYLTVLDFSFFHFETLLSYFGKICVALYAFISGYGMAKKSKKTNSLWKMTSQRLVCFYTRYWLVFFVFIPYGIVTDKFQINESVKNLFGLASSYNAEWWYVKEYIVMLILFPIFMEIYHWLESNVTKKVRIGLLLIISIYAYIQMNDFRYVMVFIEGIVFAWENIFELISRKHIYAWQSLIGLGVIFLARAFCLSYTKWDIVLAPLFIYCICVLTENKFMEKYINPLLRTVGKYSTYIWLTHTFFAYYYFQKLNYMPKISILIWCWNIVMCIVVGWVLDKVFKMRITSTPNKEAKQQTYVEN